MSNKQTDQAADRLAELHRRAADTSTPNDSDEAKKSTASIKRRKWKSFYSDMELAERFLASDAHVRFVSEYAQWLRYDDSTGVWQRSYEHEVRGLIQCFLKAEFTAAQAATDPVRLEHADACQRTTTGKRILDWIAPTVSIKSSALDSHKDHIVVANGVVDLRTSALLPYDPELLFTKRIAYPYKAGATNALTAAALDSLPADAHHQFKVMAGQALTGHQPSRSTIFFMWGDGSNGKSTLIDLLSTTAGDYGKKPPRALLLKGGGDSNFHTIAFKGARQALIEELPDERFLDGGVIRDLAGTTTMTGEHKGKDVEEFEVQATIFITFNNRPQVTETAHGVWRRLKLFPFPFKYVENKGQIRSPQDRLQQAQLKDLHLKSPEAVTAFLAWRIEGARLWYEAGRVDAVDAPSVEEATKSWRGLNDALAHWFEENLVADPTRFVLVDDLLDDFNAWRNMPKATWGKHNLLDKFMAHTLFLDNGLAYKRASRHRNLKQSTWLRENPADWDKARIAKAQTTFVAGVRFRDASDDLTVPDDASELTTGEVDALDRLTDDEELSEAEEGAW